jgi:phospholipase C
MAGIAPPRLACRAVQDDPSTRWLEAPISRRNVLRAGAAGGIGLGVGAATGAAPFGFARPVGGAKGLGPGDSILPPGSLPHPHLPAGTETIPQIEHVVVLMMENHSFDDHLGMLGRGDGLTLGHDGLPVNYNPAPTGGFVRSFHMPNTNANYNGVTQTWDASHLCFDGGTNMGFAKTCSPVSLGYWDGRDLPFYYGMAGLFPIGDRYFCSVMAQTHPNRRFLIAATALGDVTTGTAGVSSTDAPNGTIFDRLDQYKISWKNYYPDVPTCGLFLPVAERAAQNGNLGSIADFLSDAAAGKLPAFSLVDPYVNYSEEGNDISVGEAYAATIIKAVLASPNWASSALIWIYDEHGGWFDHVPPVPAVKPDNVPPEITVPPDQPGSYDYTGFRVPCCVVSPWAKRDYVSHVVYDHTSVLKFVETKWNLPALTYRDANANNLLDFFAFTAHEPPFAEAPSLPEPLNPFRGPLPVNSAGTFHEIAPRPIVAGTPPAAAFSAAPPPDANALIAAHTRQALGLDVAPAGRRSSGGSSSLAPVLGGTLGGVVVVGAAAAAIGLRRRGRAAAAGGPTGAAPPVAGSDREAAGDSGAGGDGP